MPITRVGGFSPKVLGNVAPITVAPITFFKDVFDIFHSIWPFTGDCWESKEAATAGNGGRSASALGRQWTSLEG